MKIEDLISAVATCEIIASIEESNTQRYFTLKFHNNKLTHVDIAEDILARELYARVYYKELVIHCTLDINDDHEIWSHIPELRGKFNQLNILKSA